MKCPLWLVAEHHRISARCSSAYVSRARLIAARIFLIILLPVLPHHSTASANERCTPVVARIVSFQGNIALWTPEEPIWKTTTTGAVLCPQDRVRVGADSRAALLLTNETTLRLNQKTTITINPLQEPTKSFIDLIEGAIHIMTRTPMAMPNKRILRLPRH